MANVEVESNPAPVIETSAAEEEVITTPQVSTEEKDAIPAAEPIAQVEEAPKEETVAVAAPPEPEAPKEEAVVVVAALEAKAPAPVEAETKEVVKEPVAEEAPKVAEEVKKEPEAVAAEEEDVKEETPQVIEAITAPAPAPTVAEPSTAEEVELPAKPTKEASTQVPVEKARD